ncbi:type ISP restriction/modification enzyme [Psychroserpens ponticola]|uniref:type ISP restriction/modification enzyme n=1 Tax=Psychroserpens ponticola TaxID=2932268 RepID=UPI002938D970|nr:type ISP restriction/modification enzyme [Psychroserpens ponticola]
MYRKPNLNETIVNDIAKALGLTFVPEQTTAGNVCFANNTELRADYKTSFAPIDLLDYIYAVLHSPTYRETYKEFLKIDFPRVPYPKDQNTFWELVKLGGELRQIHLLEQLKTDHNLATYPEVGDNVVTRKMSKNSIGFEAFIETSTKASTRTDEHDHVENGLSEQSETSHHNTFGKVWINDIQYFDNVPQVAWEFYIGGYQPAQKWLKDRKDSTLTFEDILHYQNIIVALSETHRIMNAIDNITIE